MDDKKFDTLIKKNDAPQRWYPQPVSTYKRSIIVSGDYDETNRIKSNFAYSMQYIEFIEKEFDELILSEVLATMLIKSYIITGMGIIEMLLVNILHSTNHWNTSQWGEYKVFISNRQECDGRICKVETHLFEQIPQYDMRMDLDSMIKRAEKKNLLTINHDVFPALKMLRELRNRVHLQIGENSTDHDYNVFQCEHLQMMRRILFSILTCKEFCAEPTTFDFIKTIYESHY